jgi:cytosine/uracil/thiamine/allantoin permease
MDKLAKVLLVLQFLFIVAILGLVIYVYVKYGGKPITEIPSWAVPFFLGK